MSLQSLVSELQSLRRDLSELSARVLALENQVTSTTEARFTTPPASPLVINYTGLSSPSSNEGQCSSELREGNCRS